MAYLVVMQFLVFFFSRMNAEHFVDDCYKREAYLGAYSGSIPPYVGERHWPRIKQQLSPPSIKIGPGRTRKNRRKDPHEDPKRPRRLTKNGIEMSCIVCKSKKHTKRKCLNKDRVVEPTPKRLRGRLRKDGAPPSSSQASSSSANLSDTAMPIRTGRGGRFIKG